MGFPITLHYPDAAFSLDFTDMQRVDALDTNPAAG